MELKIFGLVLLAAFLHAAWNALVKVSRDSLLVLSSIALATSVAGAIGILFVEAPARESWPAIALSLVLHFIYYWFLYRSYKLADYSQIYPVARGASPVIVALGAYIFTGETLPPVSIIGIVVASVGIVSLSLAKNRQHRMSHSAFACALGTGLIIAAYTVVDGIGVRMSGSPFGYISWLFFLEFPVVLFVFAVRRRKVYDFLRAEWRFSIGAGLSSVMAYGLILYAINFAPMAAVSALRESGVLIAVLIGSLLMGERGWRNRMAAASFVVTGILLITFGLNVDIFSVVV